MVAAHLQRIKSRRADIPNPEIPVRITLALDKLPDLVRGNAIYYFITLSLFDIIITTGESRPARGRVQQQRA